MKLRNALLQLFVENSGAARKPLNVMRAEDANEATIFIYDAIGGYFGVDAQEFAVAMAGLQDVDKIHLRINSPGGDVFDARAMQTTIAQHPAYTIAHIDGMAASAATYLTAPADEIEIAQGSAYMIHNGWTLEIGDKRDHRNIADRLEEVDGSIARDLSNITNDDVDIDQIIAWMDAETWFTADQALEHGFVNRVFDYADADNNRSQWNVAAYQNAPDWLKNQQRPKDDLDPRTFAESRRAALLRRIDALDAVGS